MGKYNRKFDQFLSVIVLLLYAVIITIKWIMIYQEVPQGAITAIDIIQKIIQCLVIVVLLYNALGWTDSWILKIVFIVIAAFLLVTSFAGYIPQVKTALENWNVPSIF